MRRLVLLLAWAIAAHAAYPEKPIRVVVPSAPGGSPDVLMRILMQQLSQQMNVPIVVENKPGASFVLGTMDIVRAPADGYTLGYGNIVSLAINRSLMPSLPYDVEKDLTLISNVTHVFNMLAVNNNLPVHSVAELIDYAKRNPGKLTNGSSGNGTTGHLGGELFKAMTGVDIVHVPYKGSGDAMKDHLSGAVQLFFDGPTTAIANAKSGKVKLLATAAETRKAALPDLPTMREAGYDVGMWGYLWFWGPAGMNPVTLDTVYRHVARAVAQPDVQELFANGGSEAMALPPAEMARAARDLYERWGAVIRMLDVRLD